MRTVTDVKYRLRQIERHVAARDWPACVDAMAGVTSSEMDAACHRRLLQIYEQLPDELAGDIRVWRGLSQLYYDGCLHGYKRVRQIPKKIYVQRAVQYFQQLLLGYERTPFLLYQYAYLLDRSRLDLPLENLFRNQTDIRAEVLQCLDEAMTTVQRQGIQQHADLYCRICYRYARCLMDTLRWPGNVAEEMGILFPKTMSAPTAAKKEKFLMACRLLETVRQLNHVPRTLDLKEPLRQTGSEVPQPLYLYYALGKLLNLAAQGRFCADTKLAWQSARRYYTYACQWDVARSQDGKPPFGHALQSLLTLYIQIGDERAFTETLTQYETHIPVTAGFRLLCTIRWAIRQGEYAKAYSLLVPYLFQAQWYPGFSRTRAEALKQIVEVALGRKNPLTMRLPAWQQRQLQKILHP